MMLFLISLVVLLLVNVLLFSFSVNTPEKKIHNIELIKKDGIKVVSESHSKTIKNNRISKHEIPPFDTYEQEKTTKKQEGALVE